MHVHLIIKFIELNKFDIFFYSKEKKNTLIYLKLVPFTTNKLTIFTKYVLYSLKVPARSPIWHELFLVVYTFNLHLLVLYMFSRPDSFKNQVMFRCLQYHCCYKYFIYSYQNIVFNAWLLYNTSLNLKRSAFVMTEEIDWVIWKRHYQRPIW